MFHSHHSKIKAPNISTHTHNTHNKCHMSFCDLFLFRNHFVSSYFCILLVVWWCFSILTACHLIILHVKLNVIKLFNRLSLLANQTASTLSLPASVKVNHTQNSNRSKIAVTTSDADCEKPDVSNNNLANDKASRKFIMSSSLQLHEDDLSRIDVKSLVSVVVLFFGAQIYWDAQLSLLLWFRLNSVSGGSSMMSWGA